MSHNNWLKIIPMKTHLQHKSIHIVCIKYYITTTKILMVKVEKLWLWKWESGLSFWDGGSIYYDRVPYVIHRTLVVLVPTFRNVIADVPSMFKPCDFGTLLWLSSCRTFILESPFCWIHPVSDFGTLLYSILERHTINVSSLEFL